MEAEKNLIIYKNGTPIKKLYVKRKQTFSVIENYLRDKYPGYSFEIYNGDTLLEPYDYDRITDGKIVLTPLPPRTLLSKQLDTDKKLADNLSDRDLLNLCLANPDMRICKDDQFWKNRLFSRYGEFDEPDSTGGVWKKFYLHIVYFMDKADNDIDKAMELAAEKGEIELVEFFIKFGATDFDAGLFAAAKAGDEDIVDLLVDKGADVLYGLHGVSMGGPLSMVDHLFNYVDDADDEEFQDVMDRCTINAASVGRLDLVKIFEENGTGDMGNMSLVLGEAAANGHLNIVDYILKNYSISGQQLRDAIESTNPDPEIVEYMKKIWKR